MPPARGSLPTCPPPRGVRSLPAPLALLGKGWGSLLPHSTPLSFLLASNLGFSVGDEGREGSVARSPPPPILWQVAWCNRGWCFLGGGREAAGCRGGVGVS